MAISEEQRMSTGKILVTGASGFIGSALVNQLMEEERAVIPTARKSIELLSNELDIRFSKLDVMAELPCLDGIETLIHCATPNDIDSRKEDGGLPLAVFGTRRLLEKAAKEGVRRAIYLSTLQVYGTELQGHIDENTSVKCETTYGLNHYLGEEVCRYIAQTTELDIVALRPSNVYGVPKVSTVKRDTLVPMCFVKEACETGKVCLRSSGRQMRNFISTDEVAAIITQLLDNFPPGYTVVNAVSAWGARICDIAEIFSKAWQEVKNSPLQIQIMSDKPERTEPFTVTSRRISPQLSEAASRQRMATVIKQLIDIQSKIKVRSA